MIGFIGDEPFINREPLRCAVRWPTTSSYGVSLNLSESIACFRLMRYFVEVLEPLRQPRNLAKSVPVQ